MEIDAGLYQKAKQIVSEQKKCSTSFIQRTLKVGYNMAANIVDRMEKDGFVSAPNHIGKREILNSPVVSIETAEGKAVMGTPEAAKLMENVVRRGIDELKEKQQNDFQKVQDEIDEREVARLKVRFPTITLKKDGDMWCAHGKSFTNLQESPANFAKRPGEALRAYLNEHEPELLHSPIVVLRTDYLKAASMAASEGADPRAYLSAVFVEVSNEEGVRYTGTDGHHLVTILDDERVGFNPDPHEFPDFAPFTMLIPAVVVKELDKLVLKAKKGEESLFGNSVKAQRIKNDLVFTSLAGGDETKLTKIECREVDGQYPDYRRVIPNFDRLTKGTPAQLVSFDWSLCHNIQKAWALYRWGKPTQLASCAMNFGGEMEPALFTQAENRFVGVVMPLRCATDGRAATDKPVVGADPFAPPPPQEEEPEEDDEGEGGEEDGSLFGENDDVEGEGDDAE